MSDLRTNIPDTDYFFLGDGRVMMALQWSRNVEASPYGIILYDPERMSRKNGSLLFHPELGLARTMLTAIVDGVRHTPKHDDVRAAWNPLNPPSIVVRWKAGDVEITEQFSVQQQSSNIIRNVTISSPAPCTVEIEAALYANPLFFDEFGVREGSVLHAGGYAEISIFAVPEGRAFERFLTVPAHGVGDGVAATFIYAIEEVGTHELSFYPNDHHVAVMEREPAPAVDLGRSFGENPSGSPSLAGRIMELERISRISLRASVSRLGKFDASIWQYDFEWGMDAAMVATAAASAGMVDLAGEILVNIMRRLSNAEGMIAEASRFRGGEMSELNGNGAVLDALWHYWRWSGDLALPRAHWHRWSAIADYPLRPEFQHPSGLLKTRRDLWERLPWMGVGEGFELGHQVFCVVGLRRAAEMARALGHDAEADRWHAAGERILDAMLHHPTLSLVEDGGFIHRRLVDGSVQAEMVPDLFYTDRDYNPYIPSNPGASAGPVPCEPDIAEALPIIYGLIDPTSDLARTTLTTLDSLWNPTGIGGYARYNIASDPDSPGPWAFATAFMAAAEIEARLDERAHRTIGWLLDAAGAGGSWFEYYGERQSPPYPPVGIIVWGWAQYLLLVVKHLLGARVAGDGVSISPKLIGLEHTLRVGGRKIRVQVRGLGSALLDGAPIAMTNGTVRLPLPLAADHLLEFRP